MNEENRNNTSQKQMTARQKKARKKTASVAGKAVVFGLVAGAVMFSVNSIGNTAAGTGTISAEAVSSDTDTVTNMNVLNNLTSAEPVTEATGDTVNYLTSDISQINASSESLDSVEAVVRECMPSVVTIATVALQDMQSFYGGSQQYEAQGAGTGVIVEKNDTELFIATNNHVVEGATSLSVGFIDESSCEATIKGTDTKNDLAVIAVKLEDISDETMSQIKIAAIGNSDDLNLGEQVVAIGNALGEGQSVTTGCISAKGREIQLSDGKNIFVSSDLIQTDASINPGNSGGALLNMKGELIGINEAKASYTTTGATVDNVGYAIPISKAQPILNNLMTQETRDKAAEPGYLGVTCKDITADSDLVTFYGFPEGVCFLEVIEGGPCAEAGFQKGDVLTKFDGREISSFNDLKEILEYYSAGEQVDLTVLRQNNMNSEYEEITKTVTLCGYESIQNIYTAG